MDFKEWMESASDSLARAVAKAAKPFYRATRPAQKKKSSNQIDKDANANYIYINSLSKVSNKSCPVREKQAAAKAGKPKYQAPAVQKPVVLQKNKGGSLAEKFNAGWQYCSKQTILGSKRVVAYFREHTLNMESLKQLLGSTKSKLSNFNGFGDFSRFTKWDGFKKIDFSGLSEIRNLKNIEQAKVLVRKYPFQFAGAAGTLCVLLLCVGFYQGIEKAPANGSLLADSTPEKQVVENSFNSTQTIMLEDRVPGKPDLSDVISMDRVRDYSRPGYSGYAIAINGKEVGFFKDQATAQGVIEQLKSKYAAPTKGGQIVKVFFKERVGIVAGYRPVGRISDYSDAKQAAAYIFKGGNEEQAYVVQEGETFWDISVKNNISVDSLLAANPDIKPERLQIGDELSLIAPKSLVTVCVVEKAKFNELIPYEVKYIEAKNAFKGDSSLKTSGQNGEKIVTADILKENGHMVARNVLSETILSQPVTKVVAKGTKIKPRTAATGKFARPVGRGASFSSDFGWRWGRRHTGVDLSCHVGTGVFAADGGTVTFSGSYSAYGRCIIISHGNGLQTYYAHNSKLLVSEGDKVYKGQKIALSGNTGRSTGPHLHFEVRKGGVPVNPEKYLNLR